MAQVKVYVLAKTLEAKGDRISEAIHESLVEAIGLPLEKKFQRFIPLEKERFIFPSDRSDEYLIIEISMFEGRSKEMKKELVRALYQNIGSKTQIRAHDIEITLFETPRANWGIRGVPGDELNLDYKIEE